MVLPTIENPVRFSAAALEAHDWRGALDDYDKAVRLWAVRRRRRRSPLVRGRQVRARRPPALSTTFGARRYLPRRQERQSGGGSARTRPSRCTGSTAAPGGPHRDECTRVPGFPTSTSSGRHAGPTARATSARSGALRATRSRPATASIRTWSLAVGSSRCVVASRLVERRRAFLSESRAASCRLALVQCRASE